MARKNGSLRGRYRIPTGNETKGIYDLTDVLLATNLGTWASKTTKVDILLIAGGGGGAMVENGGAAGGGGAGGVLYGTNITLISGNVTIGAGGAGSLSSAPGFWPTSGQPIGSYGTRGANTTLTLTARITGLANLVSNTYICYGGGAAQSNIADHNKGGSGASSGLAYQTSQSGLQGSFTGYGNDGGTSSGGGANTAGSSYTGGAGKLFVDFPVGSNSAKGNTGTLGYVAGGGSGSSQSNNNAGAVGGGGNGYEAYTAAPADWPIGINGWPNTGGGGGGSGGPGWYSTNGGNGGSGLLVIRVVPGYPLLGNTSGALTVTSNGSTFYVFTSSGSFSI